MSKNCIVTTFWRNLEKNVDKVGVLHLKNVSKHPDLYEAKNVKNEKVDKIGVFLKLRVNKI